MNWSTVCVSPATSTKLITVFNFFWIFIGAGCLAKRGRTAGPVAAVLVPLALGAADAWIGLARAMWGMAVVGGGKHAVAAGLAEALSFVWTGAAFAVAVLIAAAIRRHRLFVDRLTASLFAILIASVAGVCVMAHRLTQPMASVFVLGDLHRICIVAAVVTAVVALVAIAWTALTGRGRTVSAPLRYALSIVAVLFVALVAITWWIGHGYREFAMGRG